MTKKQEEILKDLTDFLHLANKNTFANADAKKTTSLRPESSDYHFEDGDFIYHDTYFGNRDFIGEEIVYHKEKPLWGMNYFGVTLNENITNDELGSFLEKSIMQEYKDIIPVRGPKEFTDGKWEYKFIVNGGLDRFSGTEEILFKGSVVYRLSVQGGFLI